MEAAIPEQCDVSPAVRHSRDVIISVYYTFSIGCGEVANRKLVENNESLDRGLARAALTH